MQSLEQLQKSLQEVKRDLKITKKQLKNPTFCSVHSMDVSKVFAGRERILREQLFDLECAKLDLERQINELEE